MARCADRCNGKGQWPCWAYTDGWSPCWQCAGGHSNGDVNIVAVTIEGKRRELTPEATQKLNAIFRQLADAE